MQDTAAAIRQFRGDPPEEQRIMQLMQKTVAHNEICLEPLDLPQIPMQELDDQVLISGTLTLPGIAGFVLTIFLRSSPE